MGVTEVKNIILVLSGKGGVGKSSISVHLALSLRDLEYKVGILDVDLCGPSVPHLLNLENKEIHNCAEGWMPVFLDQDQSLCVMSIGFLLTRKDEAVVWRGPKKNAMIKQFLFDVKWPELDYLVIDMPPGTSDEHISLIENVRSTINTSAVLVTTPQLVAVNDVRREISFCNKTKIPILGIIENMSGFACPNCHECTNIFSKGGGEALAQETNTSFLGTIPIDSEFTNCLDKRCVKEDIGTQETLNKFNSIVDKICQKLNQISL